MKTALVLFEDFEKKIGADRVKLQDQYDAMHRDIIKQVKDADTKAEAAEKECVRLRQENSALSERVNKLTDDLTSRRKDETAELPARL